MPEKQRGHCRFRVRAMHTLILTAKLPRAIGNLNGERCGLAVVAGEESQRPTGAAIDAVPIHREREGTTAREKKRKIPIISSTSSIVRYCLCVYMRLFPAFLYLWPFLSCRTPTDRLTKYPQEWRTKHSRSCAQTTTEEKPKGNMTV